MAAKLDNTIWRGMQVCHPADWELSTASARGDDGRCSFSDRAYERLDVRWRPLKYVPDMAAMVVKHRDRLEKETELSDLSEAPPEWKGLLRKTPAGGVVIHAGRFFQAQRLLAEVMLVWPSGRDVALERAVLQSIEPQGPQDNRKRWRAMGIEMTAPCDYDVFETAADVGRVKWTFRREALKEPSFTIQRIALPEYWLNEPLAAWLPKQLPPGHEVVDSGPTPCNGHDGQQLLSRCSLGRLSALRGRVRVRQDWVWQCPIERRVYHAAFMQDGKEADFDPPQEFGIVCCRPTPVVAGSRT